MLYYVEKTKDSLTAWASVLASCEESFLVCITTICDIGVQLPLIIRGVHRSTAVELVGLNVIICRTEGSVAVSSGVVCSSSSQCSHWTDELRSGEAF